MVFLPYKKPTLLVMTHEKNIDGGIFLNLLTGIVLLVLTAFIAVESTDGFSGFNLASIFLAAVTGIPAMFLITKAIVMRNTTIA